MPGGRNSGAVYNMYKVRNRDTLNNLLCSSTTNVQGQCTCANDFFLFFSFSLFGYTIINLGQSRLNLYRKGQGRNFFFFFFAFSHPNDPFPVLLLEVLQYYYYPPNVCKMQLRRSLRVPLILVMVHQVIDRWHCLFKPPTEHTAADLDNKSRKIHET